MIRSALATSVAALPRVVTIGAYGFDAASFFARLTQAEVDLFCDLRRRRGVRGAGYAFANRRRLQDRLGALGIRYVHSIELAPSQPIRDLQKRDDESRAIRKRDRGTLSGAFAAAYRAECLTRFDATRFLSDNGPGSRVVALFCVEREPGACHRSLVAERFARDLGIEPEHLRP